MRVSIRDDTETRKRAQAAARERRPAKRRGDTYLTADPGELVPRCCRCTRPAVVADLDRTLGIVTVSCLACGKERAVLNRLDLQALAAVRRATR